MRRFVLSHFALFAVSALTVTLVLGCRAYRSSGQTPELDSGVVEYEKGPGIATVKNFDPGLLVPDGRGGFIYSPGVANLPLSANAANAQELRLRIKELAGQLLETQSNDLLAGLVALPTTFVNLNDFNDTSPFGRYIAEAMFHEFTQRGFPVREYRLNGKIALRPDQGEFALTRRLPALSYKQSWSAVLVGTYLKENNVYFVNARLVRPADGMVLRSAQLVFLGNPLLAQMTNEPVVSIAPPTPSTPKSPISTGSLRINSRTVPSSKASGTAVRSSSRSSSRAAPMAPVSTNSARRGGV